MRDKEAPPGRALPSLGSDVMGEEQVYLPGGREVAGVPEPEPCPLTATAGSPC